MVKQQNLHHPCGVCGEIHPESFKIWFDGYIKLYKCLKCGFISQFPGPGEYTIIDDYENRYTLDFLNQGKEFMYPYRRKIFQDTLNRILAIKKPEVSLMLDAEMVTFYIYALKKD